MNFFNNNIKNYFINFKEFLIKNSIVIGIKKGYHLDTLPIKVRLFIELPLVRIMRVIGGLTVLFYLLRKNGIIEIYLPNIIEKIIIVIALIQLIQIFVISIIKFVFGLNKLIRHRKEFEVRNSPLNRLASLSVQLAYCWKVGCQVGSSGISLLGASVLIDGLLDSVGHDKIFEPILKKGVDSIVGSKNNLETYKELAKKTNQLKTESDQYKMLVKMLDKSDNEIDKLINDGVIKSSDGDELKDGIKEIKKISHEELKEKSKSLTEAYKSEFKKRFEDSKK